MIELKVESCADCFFAFIDREFGEDVCQASKEVSDTLAKNKWYEDNERLPREGVHRFCPLKKGAIIVNLK